MGDAAREQWMREAIALSGRGYPAPNPRVGCVVVRDGNVVGRGWHAAAGKEHAEIVALREAGDLANGADMYVTLEPCKHHGKTPPCVEAICNAKVAGVSYAVEDPNPEAAGGGVELLSRGVKVDSGLLSDEAYQENRVFLRSFELGRPYVLVKAACTLDGKIAMPSGESRWITGDVARKRVHELRAELGCVLIGGATAASDDPSLTVRDIEVAGQPLRVVLDTKGDLSKSLKLFSDGIETVHVTGKVSLTEVLADLWGRGIRGVLVEGGGKTIGRFFEEELVDEVELHVAPKVFGAGVGWCESKGVAVLANAWRLKNVRAGTLGDDIQICGEVAR